MSARMSRAAKLGVGAVALIALGTGIYLLFLRGPTTDIGRLAAWSDSACDGTFTHTTRSPGGLEGFGRPTVENEFGTGFKLVLDHAGSRVDFLDCEVGGSALLYMGFESNAAALHAAKDDTGKPLCQLDSAVFFTGNKAHMRDYCERLGGAITQPPHPRRPPISSHYPPSRPCGNLHFDKSPRDATDIRVGGGSCSQAIAFVRGTHAGCARGVCDNAGYRCDDRSVATQVLAVGCRNLKTKITWGYGGYY
jgi:hypothetical protein